MIIGALVILPRAPGGDTAVAQALRLC